MSEGYATAEVSPEILARCPEVKRYAEEALCSKAGVRRPLVYWEAFTTDASGLWTWVEVDDMDAEIEELRDYPAIRPAKYRCTAIEEA